MSEIYGYCVGVLGIDPLYFLDEMSMDEVSAVSKAWESEKRTSWEQVRTLSFYSVVAQIGTKRYKKPKDLFPLMWDNKSKGETIVAPRLTENEFLKAAKQIR